MELKEIVWKEYKIKDIVKYGKSKNIPAKNRVFGKYEFWQGGTSNSGYHNEYNNLGKSITISGGGSSGYVHWQENKFWGSCHVLYSFDETKLPTKFLYHVLKWNEHYFKLMSTGTAITHFNKWQLDSYKIKLPDLENSNSLKLMNQVIEKLDNITNSIIESKNVINQFQNSYNGILKKYFE
ncbi:MAG: hypothetical protein TYPL_5220 [Candidatus Tyloplasma litorale]|nr:MAG: hypothetical protein TYPL_5220 [Mycoplasmatales bacterium]